MVSTHQQYLCPDFLNPSPPTTVDSSPLALLAQTCNSIGLPEASGNGSNSKSGKSDSNSKSVDSGKNQTKEETTSKSNSSKKTTTSLADSSSDSSSTQRSSPAGKDTNGSRSPETSQKVDSKSRPGNVSSADSGSSSQQSSSADVKSTLSVTVSSSAAATIPSSASSSLLLSKCMAGSNPLATFPSPFPPALFPPYFPTNSTPAAFPYAGMAGHVPSLGMAAGACYPPFPSSVPVSTPWLPSALPGFTPKCMDPFCKTCPAIAAGASASGVRGACGALGCPCLQCGGGHSASDFPLWLPSYSSLVGLHGAGAGSSPASMYAAAAAVAAAAQQQANALTGGANAAASSALGAANQPQQHTCSWVTGSEFCGKHFSSSEELLQHLRSHTSQDSAAAAAAAAVNSSSGLSTPAVSNGVSAGPAHLSAGGRLSPRSTYLGGINSLRYHPYSKLTPSSASASAAAAALASIPFPSSTPFNPLSALCSSLSAQRLPASLPHQ